MVKKVCVYGMHCKSCELLIENKVGEIPGVKVKNISQKENCMEVEIKNEKDLEEIKKVIYELGYNTVDKKEIKNTIFDYIIIFLIFVIFGILFYLFQDIVLFENVLKIENLSYFVIFLIGIVASMSTCLAVTGGIVLGFSKYIDTSTKVSGQIKTQLNFHIGRILGFALGGGILGAVGGYVGSFGMLNKFLLLLAGIFMIYMGLNILNLLPSISKLGISMPKKIGNKILNIKNPALAPIVGALTFFLPCGFTQSMQIYAISSSSFVSGAVIMGVFALGTMPILFLVGFGSSYFKNKNFNYINKVMGVLVVYFGISILSGFINMFHVKLSTSSGSEISQNISENQDYKEISVVHNGLGFEQDVILSGAKNYKLKINPVSDGLGCMFGLTVPGLDDKEYMIKKGQPVILDFKSPISGTYKAVCTAMGMPHGKIIIQ